MNPNIPLSNDKKRVVIVGGGFAGLKLAEELLSKGETQVVLLDRQNFHQFQPLFYQVATAGLEPSSISFPFRKIFQSRKNFHFRLCSVKEIISNEKKVSTSIGDIHYDMLVLALGANTNFFGNEQLKKHCVPMKSTPEALGLRNVILNNFEKALLSSSEEEVRSLMNIIIVGGGPTGVEIAGALAEMKKYILPKDYPELDTSKMNITIIEAAERPLAAMSPVSSKKALEYLDKLGINVRVKTRVKNFNGHELELVNGEIISSRLVIWAAGVSANKINGVPATSYGRADRIIVNEYNMIKDMDSIYCIGDNCLMETPDYPHGHPQVAQVALQQGKNLSKNITAVLHQKKLIPFKYRNLGSMATIGRNKAVVELPNMHFHGLFAWLIWMLVHLKSILGVKNQLLILINWMWNYFTYDQSLRLIMQSKHNEEDSPE